LSLHDYISERKRRAFFKRTSTASHPGGVKLSHAKLKQLCPEYYSSPLSPVAWLDSLIGTRASKIFGVAQHLLVGDSRAAIVVSVSPSIIAAYSDEFDCVALLKFSDIITSMYNLHLNKRLLTVNCYGRGAKVVSDLQNGPLAKNRWTNFRPIIAEFLSDDLGQISKLKNEIHETEWDRTTVLGHERLKASGGKTRDGRPSRCGYPAV